jgi:putative redox protein
MGNAPMTASLTWTDALEFSASVGTQAAILDSDGKAGLSPVQALALAIAGCMAMDVVDIVRKGRHPLIGLEVTFSGDRAETPPRRFTRIQLHFIVRGSVPTDAVTRAISLSREKYCSVSNSLRPDLAFDTSFEVTP